MIIIINYKYKSKQIIDKKMPNQIMNKIIKIQSLNIQFNIQLNKLMSINKFKLISIQ